MNKNNIFIKVFCMVLLGITFLGMIPNVYAESDISISSVDLMEKSEYTEILEEANFKDLNVSFNIKFNDINDYAKYKVVVKNNSSKDYELENNINTLNSSNYFNYSLEYNENTDIVPANSELTLYLTITYKNEVPDDMYTNGTFSEDNAVALSLLNNNINNPTTASNILIIIGVIILIGVVLFLVLYQNKKKKITIAIISLIGILPFSISALDKITINIDTHIEVSATSEFCYKVYTFSGYPNSTTEIISKKFVEYPKGMTWSEFYNSEYGSGWWSFSGIFSDTEEFSGKEEIYFNLDSPEKIKSKSMGCYYVELET